MADTDTVTAADGAPGGGARVRRTARRRIARARWVRRPRWSDLPLAGVVAVAAVLRFRGLGDQSFWYDEWVTTEGTDNNLVPHLLQQIATREGAGPPYFVLMWFWARLVGDGDVALRSFSAFAGLATVPVAHALARELGCRRRVALGAALLVAVNPMLVWYSQEARPYGLLALAGAVSLLAAARAARTGRRADLVRWGLAAGFAVAVHYLALCLAVAELAVLARTRGIGRRDLAAGAAPLGATLVLLAPLFAVQRSHGGNQSWIRSFALSYRLDEAGQLALTGPSPFRWPPWALVAGVLALGGLAVARRLGAPERRAVAVAGGVAFAGVALPVAAAAAGVDAVVGRYFVGALVPLLVAAAAALLGPRRPWPGVLVAIAVVALWTAADVAVARDPLRQRADWRGVAAAVADADAGSVLVVDRSGGLSRPIERYLPDAEPLGDRVVRVTEINVLVARPHPTAVCDLLIGRSCSFVFLGAPLPDELAARFPLAERVVLDQFVVERHRSERPVAVDRTDLLRPELRRGAVWALGGT